MSTDRQSYSVEHQLAFLADFAETRKMRIVATYADSGKSGLLVKGRVGLQDLMATVVSGNAAFQTVLVYDVSRWGRFQDVDESAHYEYLCRRAGINVAYCAEQFENDGSPMAALVKSIKRTMAAEYSRELSGKVFRAQCRSVSQGFKQGGSAGYALRRMVVGTDGISKGMLAFGERKSLQSDRVIFVVGPPDEVDMLRKIYGWYLDDQLGETAIAKRLNDDRVQSEFGRPWTAWLVKSMLTNEKYLGNMVFNRGSFKLQKTAVHNPPDQWIRRDGIFTSPLLEGTFHRAQTERARRQIRPEKADLISTLQRLHNEHGKVTTSILSSQVKSSMPKLLARHFGTISNAYRIAGLPTTSSYSYVATRRFVHEARRATLAACIKLCALGGHPASFVAADAFSIAVNLTVRIVVARARPYTPGRGRWKVASKYFDGVDFVIVVQLDCDNTGIGAYYLLPAIVFKGSHVTMRQERIGEHAEYRFASLHNVFGQASTR